MVDEKRRYFRINDSVGVAYRLIGGEEARVIEQDARSARSYNFAANFDNRIASLLEACRIQSPIAAELIDLVNKKLNFLISHLDLDADLMHQVAFKLRQVNISACGIAFAVDEALNPGQSLQLDIQLQPSGNTISALARVVACEPLENEGDQSAGYFLRLNYDQIATEDQELLIQHIVKRQVSQLGHHRLDHQDS